MLTCSLQILKRTIVPSSEMTKTRRTFNRRVLHCQSAVAFEIARSMFKHSGGGPTQLEVDKLALNVYQELVRPRTPHRMEDGTMLNPTGRLTVHVSQPLVHTGYISSGQLPRIMEYER